MNYSYQQPIFIIICPLATIHNANDGNGDHGGGLMDMVRGRTDDKEGDDDAVDELYLN